MTCDKMLASLPDDSSKDCSTCRRWATLSGKLECTGFVIFLIEGSDTEPTENAQSRGQRSTLTYIVRRAVSPQGISINQSRTIFNTFPPRRPKHFLRPFLWIPRRLTIPIIGPTRISPSRIGLSHIKKAEGLEYTCIGVTFSLGLFDGMGLRPLSTPSKQKVSIDRVLFHLLSC